jgi:hypothetical protein
MVKQYYKQDEISKAIEKFYKKLYNKQDGLKSINDEKDYFDNLPKVR